MVKVFPLPVWPSGDGEEGEGKAKEWGLEGRIKRNQVCMNATPLHQEHCVHDQNMNGMVNSEENIPV
jgi:hypothetical protein